MRIFMTGGTGFVGSMLVEYLGSLGHEITVLSRNQQRAAHLGHCVKIIIGDPTENGLWQDEMRAHKIVINLAGASIFVRWTKKNKESIIQSRIQTTANIVNALLQDAGRVDTLLSTSAVGYYGFRASEEVEEGFPPGEDFLATVAKDWEAMARRADSAGLRVVLLRFGIVLGAGGGALKKMLPIFKLGLGSVLGSGKQWFPWIHGHDLARIYEFLIQNNQIGGPVNCTAPFPVTNRQFSKALARALRRPILVPPVPSFLIKMILGELGDILLKGQRAIPKKLLDSGFSFQFPTIQQVLDNLIQNS